MLHLKEKEEKTGKEERDICKISEFTSSYTASAKSFFELLAQLKPLNVCN
jgi:hypothetical protein